MSAHDPRAVLTTQFNLQRTTLILYSSIIFISGLGNFLWLYFYDNLAPFAMVAIILGIAVAFFCALMASRNKNVNVLGTLQVSIQTINVGLLTLFGGFPSATYATKGSMFFWLFFGLAMATIIITNQKNFLFIFGLVLSSAVIVLVFDNPFNIPVIETLEDPTFVKFSYGLNFFLLISIFFVISNRYNLQYKLQKATENLYHEHDQKNKYLLKTQKDMVYKEKMAALGSLMAGIGHEINTPLSVISGSNSNFQDSIEFIIEESDRALKNLPHEIESQLIGMLQQSMNQINSEDVLTTREERKYRRQIINQLETYGVEDSDGVARQLIRAGIFTNLESYKTLFQHKQAQKFLNIVAKITNLLLNNANIQQATQKIQKITFALKNYTYQKDTQKMTPCNVIRGIDTVLTLYHNQLKGGITVEQNFEKSEISVMGFPDQLDQIWVNLLQNAIQAMAYKGTLEIKVFSEAEWVVVEFIDSGPGIPAEIRSKIFQPFFTTKDQGQGSGLGLDICSKIVQRHGGRIRLKSESERTCFQVKLPKIQT